VDFFVSILFEDDGGLSGEESCGCFRLDDDAAGTDEEIVGLIGVSSIIFHVSERENRQASQWEEATKRTCCNKKCVTMFACAHYIVMAQDHSNHTGHTMAVEVCNGRLATKKLRIKLKL